MRSKLDIAIAGAGPAGLAAALYLHRAGHRVRVFERFETPKPLGSGLILQPTGLTVLADLGLLTEMIALGARIDRLAGTEAHSGRTVLDVRYDAAPGERFGLAVHRAALFNVLHDAVARENIAIQTGTELRAFRRSGSTVQLVNTTGKVIGPFDLVIDAAGARSPLRLSAIESARPPKPLSYGAFWASLEWRGAGFDPHALIQRYERASIMIGVLPIGRKVPGGKDMAAFFWSVKPAAAPAVIASGLASWKARVEKLWPECQPYLDQIESFDELTLANYGQHTLALPVARGFAAIGDTAHSTSPQLGQGANMALLDARALAHALERNNNLEAALDAYAAARRWHVRVFQALSWAFTPFYQSDSVVLPFVRDRLVSTIARIPPAPRFLASIVAGTAIDPFRRIGLPEYDWASVASAASMSSTAAASRSAMAASAGLGK